MNATSPIVKTQYLMCSAFLVFTFFRDPFSVSLVKNFFEFSIVMPFVCANLSGWLVWSAGAHGELPGEDYRHIPSPENVA
jgi:high-affinity Fe2+/Pb2+ permease